MVLVEPELENECRKDLFLLTVFSHVLRVCGWQEGQTDKRSRWHPGGCCRVGG